MGETNRQAILRASGFLLILIGLLIWMGWQNQDGINPDGVSYIRIAHYYASGQFHLMISGYWGPMLSWIIAPLLGFVEDPLSAAHIAIGLSAIVYFIGCMAIFRVMGIESSSMFVALGIVVLFSACWSVQNITPDLLMSGILCLAISRVMLPDWCDKVSVQFSSGLFFGAAYLAKAVALPLSFILIVAAGLLWTICQQTSPTRALRSAAITFLGVILIAGPWILVLSFKYERPVFSTSGEINHALVGSSNVKGSHPTFGIFHVPEEGRVTSWEDPRVLSYPSWSPLETAKDMRYQLKVIKSNAIKILNNLQAFDLLGIGVITVIFGFIFHSPWRQNIRSDPWRWSVIFIGCLAGIYLPFFAGDARYYFATYPFLLGGCLGFMGYLSKGPSNQTKNLRFMALIVVSMSFLAPLDSWTYIHSEPKYRAAKVLYQKLKSLNISGPIASTRGKGKIALYTAFLMEVPFYGVNNEAQTVEEIEASSAKIIIVYKGTPVDSNLSKEKNFISLDEGILDFLGKDFDSRVKVYINTKI
jgi:hypothetical protein